MLPKRKNFLATQQPPPKRTRSSLLKQPSSKHRRATKTSSNQTNERSTHGSSCSRQAAAATSSRSTTFDSQPPAQLPILLLLDSAQICGAFIPHEVLNQLSSAFQHLTIFMQADNTPTPGNAESTCTAENSTLNAASLLIVENSTPTVDNTDALSEASGQQPPGTLFGSTPTVVPTDMSRTVTITWTPPRCVTTTGTSKDEREDNLW